MNEQLEIPLTTRIQRILDLLNEGEALDFLKEQGITG